MFIGLTLANISSYLLHLELAKCIVKSVECILGNNEMFKGNKCVCKNYVYIFPNWLMNRTKFHLPASHVNFQQPYLGILCRKKINSRVIIDHCNSHFIDSNNVYIWFYSNVYKLWKATCIPLDQHTFFKFQMNISGDIHWVAHSVWMRPEDLGVS